MSQSKSLPPSQQRSRMSRLRAIQTIYGALLQKPTVLNISLDDLDTLNIFDEDQEFQTKQMDKTLFKKITTTLNTYQNDLYDVLSEIFQPPRSWDKIEPLMQSILLSASCEVSLGKVPFGIIVNEYLEVTHAFYKGNEFQLVHGFLHTISQSADQFNFTDSYGLTDHV